MGYKAGDLELSITTIDEQSIAKIDATAKSLRRLASAVDKVNGTQFVFAGEKMEVLFNKINKSLNQIDTTNLEKLSNAAKSLASISKISSLSSLDKMDFEKVGKGFQRLADDIDPFLKKIQSAETSLVALESVLKRVNKGKLKSILDDGKNPSNKNGLLGTAKIGISIYMLRRMGRELGNIVQAGSDYTETLNLWQVAMRENLDVADGFINKMSKAYGISTKTLMNAQATFKNMIGSLGQISDSTAYALSEALVQMSADFSSLYNVTLKSAFEKMKSMLAGQVRPIRSAGLDMTETTLYMFYQQIGGTKTMRQLNRTEKQLLSILAVYKQMGSAGALGDMTKTLNSFANQSRMMAEYWAELKVWSGLILKDWLEQNRVLVYINAALITMTEIFKAIAKSRGIGDENYLTGMFETAEATNDEVDELQGKLLDFDKFRSLEGTGTADIGIDQKLLEAITGYSSQIENAVNEAQELAKTWMLALGFTEGENGELVLVGENLTTVKDRLNDVINAVGILLGLGIWSALVKWGTGIYTYGIVPLINLGKAIWANAIQPMISWVKYLLSSHKTLEITKVKVTGLEMAMAALSVAFLAMSFNNWVNTEMSASKRMISMFLAVAGAITAAAVAMNIFKMNWAGALSAAGIVAGSVFTVSAAIPNFEKGASDIDSGTVFRAGEFGKTEMVYSGTNGKTNVANVQQMQQAMYNALVAYGRTNGGDKPIEVYLDGEKVYENTTSHAKRRGNVWSHA